MVIGACEAYEQSYWSSLKWLRTDIHTYSISTYRLGSSGRMGRVKSVDQNIIALKRSCVIFGQRLTQRASLSYDWKIWTEIHFNGCLLSANKNIAAGSGWNSLGNNQCWRGLGWRRGEFWSSGEVCARNIWEAPSEKVQAAALTGVDQVCREQRKLLACN